MVRRARFSLPEPEHGRFARRDEHLDDAEAEDEHEDNHLLDDPGDSVLHSLADADWLDELES